MVGAYVGVLVGALVGCLVGALVGRLVGALVGAFVGRLVGAFVGALVRAFMGALVGAFVGRLVGDFVGALVGVFVGALVGGHILYGPGLHSWASAMSPCAFSTTHCQTNLKNHDSTQRQANNNVPSPGKPKGRGWTSCFRGRVFVLGCGAASSLVLLARLLAFLIQSCDELVAGTA